MSTTGQMGAKETFTWILPNGDTMSVTIDRGALALAMARKFAGFKSATGYAQVNRATALFGAIVATREKTK